MKKFTVMLATLSAFVLVFTYCADLDFNNPLDSKGDNFLGGAPEEFRDVLLDTNSNGTARYFTDRDLVCDPTPPRITFVPDYPDTIGMNTPDLFRLIMGRSQGMEGAVIFNSANPQTDRIEEPWEAESSVRIFLLDANDNKVGIALDYNDQNPMENLSADNRYLIEYDARRLQNCQIGTPGQITVSRVITVVQTTHESTDPPIIELEGLSTVTLNVNEVYQEEGLLTVRNANMVAGGSNIDTIRVVIRIGERVTVNLIERIHVDDVKDWVSTVFFEASLSIEVQTITIEYTAVSRNAQSTTVTRTVQVVEQGEVVLPEIQIVLGKYARSINVDGSFMPLNTVTGHVVGSAPYQSVPAADAFYVTNSGDTIRVNAGGDSLKHQVTFDPPITGQVGPFWVNYSHPGISGVANRGTTSRLVYNTDPECIGRNAPTIVLIPEGSSVLTISAMTPWNINQSWRVTPNDWYESEGDIGHAYQFETVLDHVSSNVLNATNPLPGLYPDVYHIALGLCGGFSGTKRTVMVP